MEYKKKKKRFLKNMEWIFCVGKGDVDESFKPHKSKEQLENVLKNRELIYNQIKSIKI